MQGAFTSDRADEAQGPAEAGPAPNHRSGWGNWRQATTAGDNCDGAARLAHTRVVVIALAGAQYSRRRDEGKGAA